MKIRSKQLKQTLLLGLLMIAGAWLGQSTANGYLHAADIFVLLACILLPTPYAAAAAGLSGAIGDLLKGYAGLAPVTLLIKIVMVLVGKALLKTKLAQKHPEVTVAPAAFVPVAGYFLYKLTMYLMAGEGLAAFAVAAGTLQKDLIQALGSILIMILFYDIYMGITSAKADLAAREAHPQQEE